MGLHRWRPFLVNIHIKISLGLLVSFFPPPPPLSSLLPSAGFLFIVGRHWWAFSLFYWCGDNTFICLQDSFFCFLFFASSPTHSNHRHRLHISQRAVSSHRRERAALNASAQAVINTQQPPFHFLPLRARDCGDVEAAVSSCGYCQLWVSWSRLWAHAASLPVSSRMTFLIITLSSGGPLLGAPLLLDHLLTLYVCVFSPLASPKFIF